MANEQPNHKTNYPLDTSYVHTGEIASDRAAYLRDLAVSLAVRRVASMDAESLDGVFYGIISTSYPNYQRPLQNES